MKQFIQFFFVIIISALAITGCNNDIQNSLPQNKARLIVQVTDSPFPIDLISNAYITIDTVEIRMKSDSSATSEKDSFVVISEGEKNFDLLQLTNGITSEIAFAELDPGGYDMIRLHVIDAKIVLKDGTEYDLKVPSGSTSGLKIKISPTIYLSEGQTSDVLLDFDVSRSFVAKGNMVNGHFNGFNFKPVVRCVYLQAAGRIIGNVTDTTSTPLEKAMVEVLLPASEKSSILNVTGAENYTEASDSILASTFTDVNGNYKLIGLPENSYTVICEMEGYESDTLQNVQVTQGNSTTVNFELK